MASGKRLVIGDDYRPFVQVCRKVLEPEFEIAGIAYDGLDLLAEVQLQHPDAVILDVSMPSPEYRAR
jgi:two-component system, response regulator, stage 0 sporulation protein A